MDDESLLEAATGMTPDGIPAAPSPLLVTLMRSRDQQTPVTPTLVTAIGGRPVSGLADLVTAARAAPASTSLAFRGVHSGKGSFSMVDAMELGGIPTSVKQFAYDKGTLQWRGVVGGGRGADALVDAPAEAVLATVDAAILPSSTRDIVVKSQAKGGRKKAAPAGGSGVAPPSRASSVSAAAPSSADATATRPQAALLQPASFGSDMLQTAPLSFASSSLIQAAVDGPNDAIAADVAASTTSPNPLSSPASVAAWLSLAAHARGRVPVHATQTWNASQIAAFKRQAVTITIYEWYPLEHNTAASKATGSGFVVDSQRGIIATNAHVAGAMVGGWEVLFFDGSTTPVSCFGVLGRCGGGCVECTTPIPSPFPSLRRAPSGSHRNKTSRSSKSTPPPSPTPTRSPPSRRGPRSPPTTPSPTATLRPCWRWAALARFRLRKCWLEGREEGGGGDGDRLLSTFSLSFPPPPSTMQGVYLGESYRATDDIGGLRARNYIKLKTLIQSAGGASGGPVFNAAGSIVGIHFAGGSSDDPRFRNTPYWRESLEAAADYLMDALADGVRDLRWPTRGGLGLELDLVSIDDAVKYFGLPAAAAAELRSVVAAANVAAAPNPPHHPRPRDRVTVVSGFEPGSPTYRTTSSLIAPGDIIYAVGSDTLAGDLLALERALHQRVNATVPLTTWRYGVQRSVDAPVYDLTADRVKRFAVWNGAVLHDVSDRTRYVYRVSFGVWGCEEGEKEERSTHTCLSHPFTPLSVQRHWRLCGPPRRRVVMAALSPRQPPLQNVVHAGQVRGDRAGGRAHAVAGQHDCCRLLHGRLSRHPNIRRRARPAG